MKKAFAVLSALVLVFSVFVSNAAPAFAAASGPNNATIGTNVNGPGSASWSSAGNIVSDDTSYATATLGSNSTSEYLQGTGYGFSIPLGVTINGISVSIMRQSSSNSNGSSINDVDLNLLKSGVIVGTDKAVTTDWPTSMTVASYGGVADMWGTTWTPAEINASNFGVSLSVVNQSGFSSRTASVDFIQVTVTYSTSNQTVSVTSHAPANAVYGSTFPVAATATSGLPVTITTTGGCSISSGTVTMTSGTNACVVHYNQSGSTAYNPAPEVLESVTAQLRPLTVTANAAGKIVGEADPALTYAVTSGSLVSGDALTGALVRAVGEDVGSYAIGQGTLSADSNYSLTYVGADFTISPVPLATVNVATAVHNDDDGTGVVSDFTISVAGSSPTPSSFVATEDATAVTLDAGIPYSVTLTPAAGYFVVYSSGCSGTMAPAGTAECTVTVDDIPVALPAGNLIPNPSLEAMNGNEPQLWSHSSWGTNNASFTYPVQGVDDAGAKAANITIGSYTDGDAKWFFDPISVSANSDYVYEARYKSTVPTRVVVAEESTPGSWTFSEVLSNVAASAELWGRISLEIHTKPTTTKLTVYHLIAGVGSLTIDRAALLADDAVVITNNVPNFSVEQVSSINPNLPRAWYQSGWGNNTPSYEYVSGDGHTGTRSVKMTMSNYVDGDAKWTFAPQQLAAGDYRFTAWYKTQIGDTPRIVARFLDAGGHESFFGMPNGMPRPIPADDSETTWQSYTGEFSVPANAVSVNIFFVLRENGWIQVDDFAIQPYTYIGFDRPLITLTFDDGAEDNVANALPVLNGYGFDSTQCFNTFLGVDEQSILPFSTTASAQHEICAHTVTHTSLISVSPEQLEYELSYPKTFLESLTGESVTSFATPYGDYNGAVLEAVQSHYAAHRTVDEGYNSRDNLNVYRLRVQNMTPTTTLAQFQGWVNKAIADKTWLVLVYHGVRPTGAPNVNAFDTYKPDFDAQMAWLNGKTDASQITVRNLRDAIAEVTAIPAGVTISDLQQIYDGTAKEVTVTTDPTGLATSVTYDGSVVVPINAGSYAVVATVTAPGYKGSATDTLVITPDVAPVIAQPDDISVEAVSSAGTVVDYVVPAVTDLVNPELVASCSPESGSVFSIGSSVVTCTAGPDNVGQMANPVDFTVTVSDTINPVTEVGAIPAFVNVVPEVVFTATDAVTTAPATACKINDGEFAACVSPFIPTLIVDGAYTVTVKATDAAGLTGEDAVSFTLDTAVPTATVSYTTQAPTNADVIATLVSDSEVLTVTNNSGEFTRTFSENGEFTFEFTDEAGNPGTATASVANIDKDEPGVHIDTDVDEFIQTDSLAISFTADDGATLTCQLDGGLFEVCASPVQLAALTQGEHAFVVRATDTAGNFDEDEVSFVVDTIAPILEVTLPPSVTNSTPVITFSATDATALDYACAVDGGDADDCSSNTSFATPTLSDGEHTVTVTVTDEAGNSTSDSVTFTVDATAPVIVISNPADDSFVNSTDIAVEFSIDGATVSVCTFDGAPVDCTSPLELTGLTETAHTFTVEAQDSVGNTSDASITFTVDVTAPSVTITSTASDPTAQNPIPVTVTFSEPVSGFEESDLDVDGGTVSDFAGDSSVFTFNVTPDGELATVTVDVASDVAQDIAGNGNTAAEQLSRVYDHTAPSLGINTPSTNDSEITGTTDIGNTVTVEVDGSDYEAEVSGTNWSVTLDSLTDGTYVVTAIAENELGVETTATAELVIDTTGPVITLTGTDPLDVDFGSTYVEPGATALDTHDGDVSVTVGGDTVDTSVMDAEYIVTYDAEDAVGNDAGQVTRAVVVKDLSGPVITLNGASIVNLAVGQEYLELGATAEDNYDESVDIVVGGDVLSGSLAEGTYEITYDAVDAAGNVAETVTRSVVVTDLAISEQAASSPTTTSFTVSWTTTHPATSRVVYDTVSHPDVNVASANYGYAFSTTEDATLVTEHSVVVSGLTANTTYYFRTVSHGSPEVVSDVEGSQATSATPTPTPSSGGGGGGSGSTAPRTTPTPSPTPTPIVLGASTVVADPANLAKYGLKEGDVISAAGSSDPDVYIVNAYGYKRLFLNPVIFGFYGHLGGWSKVKTVTPEARDAFPTTGLFQNCETNDPKVYAVEVTGEDTATFHWVNMTGEAAVAQDPNFFKKVFCINNNEFAWYQQSLIAYTALSQVPVYKRQD